MLLVSNFYRRFVKYFTVHNKNIVQASFTGNRSHHRFACFIVKRLTSLTGARRRRVIVIGVRVCVRACLCVCASRKLHPVPYI